MLLSEFYFLFFILNLIITSVIVNVNTSLHLLLTAEFLWITLYSLVLIIGTTYNNLNFISLTFLFLTLSAVEFSIGLVLILMQSIISRSINLNTLPYNTIKFVNRFFMKLNVNHRTL